MKAILGVALLVLLSFPALASLGGTADSIEADSALMKGAIAVRRLASYSVHEIQGDAGTVVREYVSPGGTVFAVAWRGPFAPYFQQIFGSYFEQYSAAVKQQKASYVGRRPLHLQLPGLVVDRSGRMRAELGRAYIPQQVPAGVQVEALW